MAYKQTPGRGNGTKTGAGISPTLMSGSPMRQEDPKVKKALGLVKAGEEAAKKRASIKKLSERDRGIEIGAATDSIEASNKAGDLCTKRQKAAIGNKAANKTRKESGATTTVTKTQVEGKKGFEDKYTRTPAKQMAKKSPMKQMNKMPMKQMKKKSC